MAGGGSYHPLFRPVDGDVQAELNRRASFYGARVRSPGPSANTPFNSPGGALTSSYTPSGSSKPTQKNYTEDDVIAFSYGKVAWAKVAGLAGSESVRLVSDDKGDLKLYDTQRNQPKYPILQSVEITSEGTMGSLTKANFSFTIYPKLTKAGFDMGGISAQFFTPGKEVSISWGWSVDNYGPNNGYFNGIIYNFDWSVNTDLSITAKVSAVSKATLAVGASGEVTNPDSSSGDADPLEIPLGDGDLAAIIDKDMKKFTADAGGNQAIEAASVKVIEKSKTASNKLNYVCIGLPMSPADLAQTDKAVTSSATPVPPVVQPVYYVSLGDICALLDDLTSRATTGKLDLYRIECEGNKTEELEAGFVSVAPEEVFFPSPNMSKYGTDFAPDISSITMGTQCVNIGKILLGTQTIINTYREFVKENQTTIDAKNISGLMDSLIKKINYASGEMYQLVTQVVEPAKNSGGKAILSVEDSNISTTCYPVSPYTFTATIAKPILKSVSITCKPPAASAAAAFASARGEGVTQSDVKFKKGPDGKPVANNEPAATESKTQITDLVGKFGGNGGGAGQTFTTALKGLYQNYKRNSGKGHWLDRVIYPVDLSITIDGIDGFKFGDLIDTNLIPSSYSSLYFCVTKVTQTISNGNWETTLATKSRIKD